MASILKVDELRGIAAAGDITITSEGGSATMQLQQGVAKAWSNTDGVSATISINDSFNISGLVDNNTGSQQHNVTNNFSSANHVPTFSVSANYNQQWTASMATGGWITNNFNGSAYVDTNMRTVSSGDLA